MNIVKLKDIAPVIRSKNSGPYELTLDIIFKDKESYELVCESGVISEEKIASLYNIKIEDVISIVEFAPANAIKATIIRPRASGDLGETDVYGAQQHAPLLEVEISIK